MGMRKLIIYEQDVSTIAKVRAGVSGWDGVSGLARFLVNKEAAKSNF